MDRYKDYVCDTSCPIGIFDSGLGGLTVQKEVILQLPREDTIYFGDSGRAPYGTKSKETILSYAIQDTRFLLEQKVKMIVIACNTASAHAYKEIAAQVNIPVVEVIGPGALAAVRTTVNGRIGVIGTSATVSSQVYVEAILRAAKKAADDRTGDRTGDRTDNRTDDRTGASTGHKINIEVFQQACPLFVGLAEEGWWNNEVTYLTALEYLLPLKEKGIDTLVLGCTHYPLLQSVIARVMGPDVKLINSASEVTKTIAEVLHTNALQNQDIAKDKSVRSFYTSDSVEKFKALGSDFLDMSIAEAEKIEIERY